MSPRADVVDVQDISTLFSGQAVRGNGVLERRSHVPVAYITTIGRGVAAKRAPATATRTRSRLQGRFSTCAKSMYVSKGGA